jgi:hypothetical protein
VGLGEPMRRLPREGREADASREVERLAELGTGGRRCPARSASSPWTR